MAKKNGPAKIKQYSLEFKLKAVQLSEQSGVLIKDVAERCAFILSCSRSGASRSGMASWWATHHEPGPQFRIDKVLDGPSATHLRYVRR